MESKSLGRPTIHKITLSVLIAIFLTGGLLFYFRDDLFKANASLITAFCILLPEISYRYVPWIKKRYNQYFIHAVELITANLLVINALGALGFYYLGTEFDGLAHLLSGFLVTFFASFLLGVYFYYKYNQVLQTKSLLYSILLTFFFSGVAWELFEYYGDAWWGTIMASQPGQPFDTWLDIFWDSLGILIAIPFAYFQLPFLSKAYSSKKDF
jgi:hypothetical protein